MPWRPRAADWIHIDVHGTGIFVPKLTFGRRWWTALRRPCDLPIMDVHTDESPRDPMIDAFARSRPPIF